MARLAGVPADVLERAKEVLVDLEAHHVQTKQRPFAPRRRRKRTDETGGLFAELEPAVEAGSR